MIEDLRAPFPYFGGKRRVAHLVWPRLGADIANYVEPFLGSAAILLARPGGAGKIETVNDIDRMLANFWRAVTWAPDDVAAWCDWPVNEADMHARHLWLVEQLQPGSPFREQMHKDPHFFDAHIAGWWVWGICQWIGGGWCVEPQNHKHPKLDGIGKGIHAAGPAAWRKRPELDGTAPGRGVHREGSRGPHLRQRPHMTGNTTGVGVHSGSAPSRAAYSPGRRPLLSREQGINVPSQQLPKLSATLGNGTTGVHLPDQTRPHAKLPRLGGVRDSSTGVHLPSLGNDKGINGVSAPPCIEWFRALQERLRRVRVACGDWTRVLGPSVLGKGKNVGGRRPCAVFLDPPYSRDLRSRHLYAEDEEKVAERVREWALKHGDDPDLRICLAGYFDEHAAAMPKSWEVVRWTAARGYAGEANENREQETLWFSPHCLPAVQTDLFNRAGAAP